MNVKPCAVSVTQKEIRHNKGSVDITLQDRGVACDLLTILTKQCPVLCGFADDCIGGIAGQVLQEG